MVVVERSKGVIESMKILNMYQHEKLGEIYCVGEDENSPSCWMKKEKLNVFSKEYEEMDVYLDFYCFDINFERNGSPSYLKKTESAEEEVINSYLALLNGTEELEQEFIRYYNSCEFRDEYYPYYKEDTFEGELPVVEKIEDIIPFIEEKKVCVYFDGFAVALKLKFGWMAIMIRKTDIFEDDGGYTYVENIDTAQEITMDYTGVLKK